MRKQLQKSYSKFRQYVKLFFKLMSNKGYKVESSKSECYWKNFSRGFMKLIQISLNVYKVLSKFKKMKSFVKEYFVDIIT